MPDPRRATPRTDHVLADERLQAAATRLGPVLVKRAVTAALERCRAGELDPAAVADAAVAALPGVGHHAPAGGQRDRGGGPHQPGPRAAVRRRRRGASARRPGPPTSSWTSRPGSADDGAAARWRPWPPPSPTPAGSTSSTTARPPSPSSRGCWRAATTARYVVIARGELVEIGDGFRIPELMESVGARLREVGTTNRVHLADYAAAVDDSTAFVLKVHPSNFAVTGFTSSVPVPRARRPRHAGDGPARGRHRLRAARAAPAAARRARRRAARSATAPTSSPPRGDKLLGGPQAGLLLGEAGLVERLRRDPFARALRVDKLTLAALEATLVGPVPPVRAALGRSVDDLRARAHAIVGGVARRPGRGARGRGRRLRGRGRRRRRTRRGAGERGRLAARAPRRTAARRASRRCWVARCAAGCCSTCSRSTPSRTTPIADAVRRAAGAGRA